MTFKRFGILFLALTLLLSFTACQKAENPKEETTVSTEENTQKPLEETKEEAPLEKIKINVGTLKGPTGMGMVGLMESSEQGDSEMEYTFEILGTPDEMVGKVVSGEVDIAALPTNMALLLNNKTEGKLQLAAVNTLGVLYILENGETINQLEDLSGKTVHLSGKGASPDYILQYLLNAKGIEDVTIDYSLEHADLAAAMVAEDVTLGLLPQPHVTTTLVKNDKVRVALDITEEWESVNGSENPLAMGVIVVQKEFAKAHPEALESFLNAYQASVEMVNADQEKAGQLIEKYGILPNAAIAQKAIDASNIVFINASEAKPFLDQFYKVLFDFNPKSIGGKLADEAFYYERAAQ